jgi:hypothetical protein
MSMTLRILEKFKIFTAFYHLTELKDRYDLMAPIIEALDYSMSVFWCFRNTTWY